MIYDNVADAIGNTPVVRLGKISEKLYGKAEYFNPAGSIKDRAALYMLEGAKASGKLNKDTVIIEPTSGNTGIALAMLCAIEGRRLILVMPDNMSAERRKILSVYGAELVLTPASRGMKGAIEEAEKLRRSLGNAFIPSQFTNPDNVRAHYETTAKEIFRDLPDLSAIVIGVGSGGTLTGIARYIKERGLKTAVYAVEPYTSAVLSGEKPGAHGLQGIGAGFVTANTDLSLIDGVLKVRDEEAFDMTRKLAREEGLLVGITSGAAVSGALQIRDRIEGDILALLPDTGMRYLSAAVFNE
ncbi:MAG: cysteine synthase A [Christensenellales bacterium]